MLAGESQNLVPALEKAEAVYRGPTTQLPAGGGDGLARRATHLAAGVRFGLDEPETMRRLRRLTDDLHDAAGLDALLPRVLDGAMALLGADRGTLQLRDPVSGSLLLVTQSGFDREFLDHFAVVSDGVSACGRAAQDNAQTVIADVNADAGFAPHHGVAAAAGFRAVASTPLADYAGRLIGVVSTHFARPHHPAARDLRIVELYSTAAGQVIAQLLGVPDSGGVGDPVGQAVLAALLRQGEGQAPDPAIWSGQGYAGDGRLGHEPASTEAAMSRFVGQVVHRLFSVGLSLDSACDIAGDGPVGDRIAAATGEVDGMIRDVRTMMFSLIADGRNHSLERPLSPRDGQADRTRELLDRVMSIVFDVGLALQAAADHPPGGAWPHISEALRRLEDVALAIRDYQFADRIQSGPAWRPAQDDDEHPGRTADRAAYLQERMARTARALQATAEDAAGVLQQQADSTRQPKRIDYRTELKRWRAFADQAGQMAKRWEWRP